MKYLATLFACLVCQMLISSFMQVYAQNYNGCIRYYYSKGKLCCYKGTADNYISYCPTKTQSNNNSPNPSTSCSFYSYSTIYSTKCCVFPSAANSQHTSYRVYCPTTDVLASLCPGTTSCCTASVPVSVGDTTFYYEYIFCPSSTTNPGKSVSIMGAYICAIVILTSVSIISAAIITIVLINKYRRKRIRSDDQSETTVNSNELDGIALPLSGWEESVPSYEQVMKFIEVPPHIPGYTFNAKIVNTSCAATHFNDQQIELACKYTNSTSETYANEHVNISIQDTDCVDNV